MATARSGVKPHTTKQKEKSSHPRAECPKIISNHNNHLSQNGYSLVVLHHGLEQNRLPEFCELSVCTRSFYFQHRCFSMLIHRENVDDGCRVVHHECHYSRVRLDLLLDVGHKRTLRYPGQPDHSLHRILHHSIRCRVIFGADIQFHLWPPRCKFLLHCLSRSPLNTICLCPEISMSAIKVSGMSPSAPVLRHTWANTMPVSMSTMTRTGDSLAETYHPIKQLSALSTGMLLSASLLAVCFVLFFWCSEDSNSCEASATLHVWRSPLRSVLQCLVLAWLLWPLLLLPRESPHRHRSCSAPHHTPHPH